MSGSLSLRPKLTDSQLNGAIKQEHKAVKRERADTTTTPKPPLKSSRGANGQTIYHLDSDDEEEARPQRKGTARGSSPADSEVEVIAL